MKLVTASMKAGKLVRHTKKNQMGRIKELQHPVFVFANICWEGIFAEHYCCLNTACPILLKTNGAVGLPSELVLQ